MARLTKYYFFVTFQVMVRAFEALPARSAAYTKGPLAFIRSASASGMNDTLAGD